MAGLGASSPVLALDTWTNAMGTGTWSNPGNWADGTAPMSNETILFPAPGPASPYVIAAGGAPSLGSLQFDNSYQIDGSSLNVPTISVAANKTATMNLAVSAGPDFNKNGAGTLVLNGTNSLSGYLNINAGAVRVASDNNLSANSGVKLYGTLEIAGTFSTSKPIHMYGGTIKVLAGHTFTLPNGQLVGGTDYYAPLTKDGDGTLVLNSHNSRGGTTLINAGTLSIGMNAQPGYGAVTVGANATLELNNKSYLYPSVNIGTGSTVRGIGSVTTGMTLPSGGSDIFPNIVTGSSASDVFNATFSGTATSGSIININGAGTVIPYAPSYQGGYVVNGGTLRSLSSIGSGTSPIVVNNGGTYRADFTSRPVNLNNGGTFRSGNSTAPVITVAASANVTLGTMLSSEMMQISGSGKLLGGSGATINVAGPGAVLITGSNSYAGGWNVTAGALRTSGAFQSLGTGSSAVAVNGGALELSSVAFTRDISLVSGAVRASGGDVYLNGVTTVAPGANVALAGFMFVGDSPNDLTGGGPGTYIHINSGTGGPVFLQQPSNVVADWLVDGGILSVNSDAKLGAATNTVTVNPFGTVQSTGTYARNLIASGGTFDTHFGATWQNVTGSGLVKTGAGTLTVNQIQLGSLSVNAGAVKIAHTPDSSATGSLNSLTIVGNSRVDLSNNALVVRSSAGSWDGSQYTDVIGKVAKGYNGGTWDGLGAIITSEPDAASGLTTLVAMSAADAGFASPGTFRGVAVNPSDTIVGYTWGGDANLDGELNGDDYFALDSNILQSGSVFGYNNGDFNYDGVLNGDDYFVIDSNILQAQGSSPFPTGLSAVPEPAALGLLSTLFLLKRRRRS